MFYLNITNDTYFLRIIFHFRKYTTLEENLIKSLFKWKLSNDTGIKPTILLDYF